MNFVEWLAIVASPFLLSGMLYLLKEQRQEINKKIDESKADLRRLQNEIYDFAVEAKSLNEKTTVEIVKTKELVKELRVANISQEITKVAQASKNIEAYAQKLEETQNSIQDLYGRVIVLDEENSKQNKILKILIDKIKQTP